MNQIAPVSHRGGALAPTTLQEAMTFARMLADSTMVPRDYQGRPGNVLVAIQWGYEIGLGPLQAVQSIAVINGRPSVWGDAALALVRGSPACEAVSEHLEGEGDERRGVCTVKRRGQEPETRTFSVADAKKAGLWGKRGRDGQPTPWITYPDRMLQMRARGFALRDVFPDVLRGVITAEEAQDIPPDPPPPARGETITGTAAEEPRRPPAATGWSDAPPPPPAVVLRMIGPDAKEHEITSPVTFARYWHKAIGLLGDDVPALRKLREANGAHLAAASDTHPDAVKAVEAALDAAIHGTPSDETGEPGVEADAPMDDAA